MRQGSIPIGELGVEHYSKSKVEAFALKEHYADYTQPYISHCFDVFVPEHAVEKDEDWPLVGVKLARLVVNEFPNHMIRDFRGPWVWAFDACEEGPTAELGAVIDELKSTDVVDLGDMRSGAVLHLQNLERSRVAPPRNWKPIGKIRHWIIKPQQRGSGCR